MADTASDLLRLRLQEDGKADWGGDDGLNEVFQMAEKAMRGRKAISLTGNHTLSSTNFEENEYRYSTLVFSDGGLSEAPTVTAPDKAMFWWVKNTGSTYDINFKNSAGDTAVIPQGRIVCVFSTGSGCELFDPVGEATAAAATSETNAANSASAASTSASNAATSASNASTSAGNASTSEGNAATSASAASDSADEAAASAAGVNMPAMVANTFLQANTGGTAYETKTAGQVLTAIGALDKTGDTMSGELDMDDELLTSPLLKDAAMEGVDHGNSGATLTIDFSAGNYQSFTLSEACTLSFSNPPATGKMGWVTLKITNGGAYTITFPAATEHDGGEAPTFQASGIDYLTVFTTDNGTTYPTYISWAAA